MRDVYKKTQQDTFNVMLTETQIAWVISRPRVFTVKQIKLVNK